MCTPCRSISRLTTRRLPWGEHLGGRDYGHDIARQWVVGSGSELRGTPLSHVSLAAG